MPHYHDPVEYDAAHELVVVRGFTFSLRPYALEIRGKGALVWMALLTATPHFRRKANGRPEAKNNDPADFTSRERFLPIEEEGDQEETLPAALPED